MDSFFFQIKTYLRTMFLILALRFFKLEGLYVRVTVCDDTEQNFFFREKESDEVDSMPEIAKYGLC